MAEGTKSLFGFIMQNKSDQRFVPDLNTLVDFRHRIMRALIERGIDVNRHILEFYCWVTFIKSTSPNMGTELIRNFNTSSNVSLVISHSSRPTAYKDDSAPVGQSSVCCSNFSKKLGSSFPETNELKDSEQLMLRLTGQHMRPESPL